MLLLHLLQSSLDSGLQGTGPVRGQNLENVPVAGPPKLRSWETCKETEKRGQFTLVVGGLVVIAFCSSNGTVLRLRVKKMRRALLLLADHKTGLV